MSLWPSTIVVDGVAVSLGEVIADVAIHRGREDVNSDATPDTCQIRIQNVTRAYVKAFRTGVSLVVNVRDGAGPETPRFTGLVTDAALDVDELTAIAVGRLGTLRAYPVGAGDWPAETWSARVTRIFAEAGLGGLLELHADPALDPVLVERTAATAGPTTLGDYLSFLAPMVGAAIADRMDGKILVQAIGARSLTGAFRLPPSLVEYAPAWTLVLPRANVVTVRYTGDQSESVTVKEATSVAFYGERPATIDTTFAELADATERAQTALDRSAFPHWNMERVPVLEGLALGLGQAVTLDTLPPASPFDPWTPILEGWEETISGDEWRMELALSDPLASGLVLPWDVVPIDGYDWNEINPATAWRDALSLGDL